MKGTVRWVEDKTMEGITEGGKKFGIYGKDYPSPMEMLLHAHAACSFVDVIGGLKERMKDVINFFLSTVLGYILTLLLMLTFFEILFWFDTSLLYYLSDNRHILMQTNVLLMGGIAVLTPWIIVSFIMYKFMKRTILK